MAIRSHVKSARQSISLMRLLIQIRDCAGQFTYAFFLQQFPIDPSSVDWQSVTFAPFSEDGKAVSAVIVQKDIDGLTAVTAQIEALADRAVAHLDKRGFDGPVKLGDLDACIDVFDGLVCKYLGLLLGSGYASLEPTILSNWGRIFTVPLDIRGRATAARKKRRHGTK
jgi:hypothetical protein